jgi:hypothetical protein
MKTCTNNSEERMENEQLIAPQDFSESAFGRA